MRVVFCNVAYLRYYDGRVEGEYVPSSGGRWVQQNEDAHEKWNFLNVDGKCYGYVQGTSDQMHIERLNKKLSSQDVAGNVTVVWCANHPDRGTVIVGWYKHATMWRWEKYLKSTPISGLARCAFFEARAEDVILLPEEERTFRIGRASCDGKGKGFGQSNVWYADSDYGKENIIPSVLEMIDNYHGKRLNVLSSEFEPPKNMQKLTKEEEKLVDELAEESTLETLRYAYRDYEYNQDDPNKSYNIAYILVNLHQYSKAIYWYEKTLELDNKDNITRGNLMYLYQQCEMYDYSIDMAKILLQDKEYCSNEIRDELYCALADNYMFSGDVDEAIYWLDKIINESSDDDLIQYTIKTRKNWNEINCNTIY